MVRAHRFASRMTHSPTRSGAAALLCVSLVAVLAFAASAWSGQSGGKATLGPLKIGYLAPLTGPVSLEGIGSKRGFDLAIKEINRAGGVFGKPVQVFVADDQANPAIATQQARKLVQQKHVNYLFGTITGDTVLAVANVAAQAKIPFSTATVGDVGNYCNRYYWPFSETRYQQLASLIPRMVKEFGPNVALVGSDYSYPRQYNDTAKALLAKAGAKVVVEEYSPLGTSDWQPVLSKLSSASPNWILTSVVGGDAIALIKQAAQVGLLDKVGLTGISITQDFYTALPPKVYGSLVVERYTDLLASKANRQFVSRYRSAYNLAPKDHPIGSIETNAYVGALFVARAFERAGSTDPNKVMAQLQKIQMNGIYGKVGFDVRGNHVFNTAMYLIRVDSNGRYTPIRSIGVVRDNLTRKCS